MVFTGSDSSLEQQVESSSPSYDSDTDGTQRNEAVWDTEDDHIRPSSDIEILAMVQHSHAHDNVDIFDNVFAHDQTHPAYPESISDTYVVEQNDSNITFATPDMDPNRGEPTQDGSSYEQDRALFASLINNFKHEIDKCKNDNHEAKQANVFLNKELERFKEMEKHQYQQNQQQQHHQQQSYQQPSQSHFHQQPFRPQQQYLMMQQHQIIPQQQPYPMSQHPIQYSSKQPHWFDRLCEVITTQQSRHEAGSLDTPPMLTPGNYVQWASCFLRFIELRKPHGKFMKQVILEAPFQWSTRLEGGDPSTDPPRAPVEKLLPESLLTKEQKLHREADEYAMIYILQGIPNPIYRSVDAQKMVKAMWEHVHLLMEGTQLNKDDMKSKLYMEYTNITIEPGETLESYYHRFT